MTQLDSKLYNKALEQYRNREIHPEWECYQLDGSTFITQEAFEAIVGDEREHYMAWKNGCIDECSAQYWNEPAVMSYLVDRSIEEGDGGECCWIDAQPIDYARSCTFAPSDLLQRRNCDWQTVAAADNGLTYALYRHSHVDVVERDGKPTFISDRNPERSATADYREDVWRMQAFLRDKPCAAPVAFDWRGVPCLGEYDESRRRFQAAKAAFAYAVEWVDDETW
ncbi:hypothetical protein [Bifidobacterium saguinibicoloris]|uniref:hypothetical protein n=1 Tax=Bifidobacterium saguinibicoloris TaxID=2834433 RepID=UPI001C5A29F7|nr:hypothetical protein [Bifidobacterium saguinibicoloris]MBW3081742.1 hypothetical protein [Bifidobacterium saguinibicoloris]